MQRMQREYCDILSLLFHEKYFARPLRYYYEVFLASAQIGQGAQCIGATWQHVVIIDQLVSLFDAEAC